MIELVLGFGAGFLAGGTFGAVAMLIFVQASALAAARRTQDDAVADISKAMELLGASRPTTPRDPSVEV